MRTVPLERGRTLSISIHLSAILAIGRLSKEDEVSVTVDTSSWRVSQDPSTNISRALTLLRQRPDGGAATCARRTQPVALPARRIWGADLAKLVAAISKIKVANERLAVMISDPTLYKMVVARRIQRHAA